MKCLEKSKQCTDIVADRTDPPLTVVADSRSYRFWPPHCKPPPPNFCHRMDFMADCRGSGADPKFGHRLRVSTFGHRSPDLRQPPSQVRHHHLYFSPQFQNLWLFEILSRIYDFIYLCNLQIRFFISLSTKILRHTSTSLVLNSCSKNMDKDQNCKDKKVLTLKRKAEKKSNMLAFVIEEIKYGLDKLCKSLKVFIIYWSSIYMDNIVSNSNIFQWRI